MAYHRPVHTNPCIALAAFAIAACCGGPAEVATPTMVAPRVLMLAGTTARITSSRSCGSNTRPGSIDHAKWVGIGPVAVVVGAAVLCCHGRALVSKQDRSISPLGHGSHADKRARPLAQADGAPVSAAEHPGCGRQP